MTSGIFPEKWKVTYVLPISKDSNISQINNYHPIPIIFIIPKIFGSVVSKKIIPLFKSIIVDEQHGFMLDRSTTTNLLVFQHYFLDEFKAGHQVNVVYTDFSKAFDTIDLNILVVKLYNLGFRYRFHS